MKRLGFSSLVLVMMLVFFTMARHGQDGKTHQAATTGKAETNSPIDVSRQYLTALLSGDVATAASLSTPLLAERLTAEPAGPTRGVRRPTSIDFVLLVADATGADVAAELHWPSQGIAALRLRLDFIGERWTVAEVQP